jgi:hypothetical protein
MWGATCAIYGGLSSSEESPYELQLVSSKQKAIAMLGYGTCVALDNYLYCLTEGRIRYPYQYNDTLASI